MKSLQLFEQNRACSALRYSYIFFDDLKLAAAKSNTLKNYEVQISYTINICVASARNTNLARYIILAANQISDLMTKNS